MTLSTMFRNRSISTATLRGEDLIPCFADFLRHSAPRAYSELLESWRGSLPRSGNHDVLAEITEDWIETNSREGGEEANFLLEELFDYLNDIAPEGCYFGAHPGDGSDFGFWEAEEITVTL